MLIEIVITGDPLYFKGPPSLKFHNRNDIIIFMLYIHDFIIFLFRLLVGAPTADSGQPDVIKGGAVFKCPPDNPGQCDLIPFDTKGKKTYCSMWPIPFWQKFLIVFYSIFNRNIQCF